MKYLLILLSIPTFLLGFCFEFLKRGFDDGRVAERNLEKYYSDL